MKSDEFFSLTPAELHELVEEYEAGEAERDYRAALSVTILANVHRSKDALPSHIADYFARLESLRPGPPTEDELEAKLEQAFGFQNP